MSENAHKETTNFIEAARKSEAELYKNALSLEEENLRIGQIENQIENANQCLPDAINLIKELSENPNKFDMNEENIKRFVNPERKICDIWLQKYIKKATLDECITKLKKAFEDKSQTEELRSVSRQ